MPVESPCIDICNLDAAGRVCIGCYRSRDEIAAWPGMDDSQRLAVLAAANRRCEARFGPESTGAESAD